MGDVVKSTRFKIFEFTLIVILNKINTVFTINNINPGRFYNFKCFLLFLAPVGIFFKHFGTLLDPYLT